MKNPNMSEEQVIQVQDPPAWAFAHLIWLPAKQLLIKRTCMPQTKSQFKQALQRRKSMPGIPGHHSDRIFFFFQELEPYHRHSVPVLALFSCTIMDPGLAHMSSLLTVQQNSSCLLPNVSFLRVVDALEIHWWLEHKARERDIHVQSHWWQKAWKPAGLSQRKPELSEFAVLSLWHLRTSVLILRT